MNACSKNCVRGEGQDSAEFVQALEKYFGGARDQATLDLLQR
jgi:uncharacterized protein (DUF1810 family)